MIKQITMPYKLPLQFSSIHCTQPRLRDDLSQISCATTRQLACLAFGV